MQSGRERLSGVSQDTGCKSRISATQSLINEPSFTFIQFQGLCSQKLN